MKKFTTYICVLAAFAAVSCNRIENPDFPSKNGDLRFVMLTSDLATRATEPGDDTYNENTINTIDWFFFSDAEGTTQIKSGRSSVSGTNPSLVFDTATQDYADLKKTFYAYFLVNYPETISNHSSVTLANILALPITGTNFEASSMPAFVMDSYEKADANGLIKMVPASKNENRVQTVSLTRVAAKMELNINIAKSVAGNGDEVWTPEIYTTDDTPQLQAYFVNALKTSTVAATPVERSEKFVASGNAFNDAAIYFSYATSHPWVDKGESDTAFKISTTPFYTYPQAFERSANGEPYFKIFLPWTSTKKGTNNFYYKVLVPGLDTFKRNCFYHVNLDLDVIGGTTDDYVVATSDYLVAEWFSPGDMGQTGISSARFLDVPQDEYKFYNKDEMTVPVTSSHPIKATVTSVSYFDFRNKTTINITGNTNINNYCSIVSSGKNSFTITHQLERAIAEADFDCSPITFQVTIVHEDGLQQSPETVTVIQYPPIYIEQETSNGYAFVNYFTSGYNTYGSAGNDCRNNNTSSSIRGIGSLPSRSSINDSGGNTNPRQYTVFVSVLPEGSDYVIGDPRGPKGGVSNLGTSISNNYRPTSDDTQNIIAPAFKMASSYGKTSDLIFDRAEERCAAYQENGYPAGRWRVPTVAEIEFVVSLSEYNHIPQLYNTGHASGYSTSWPYPNGYRIFDTYWAGGMYAFAGNVYKTESGASTAESLTSSNLYDSPVYSKTVNGTVFYYTSAVRCVYDVWYWGDKPLDNNGNTVEKDGNRANQWLGYTHMD